jgi:hypothetical protein
LFVVGWAWGGGGGSITRSVEIFQIPLLADLVVMLLLYYFMPTLMMGNLHLK